MHFAFDLISDLHVDTWDKFDWEGQPTSPYCIVAGDISRDPEIVRETLEHLGQQYAGVFYIDGNEEHRMYLDDLGNSYKILNDALKDIPNVVYMQDHVVVVNGVAIIATNGWWTYDLDSSVSVEDSKSWFESYLDVDSSVSSAINGVAYHDATYIINTVSKLQRQNDIKSIVIVSHTVPAAWLVNHDIDLIHHPRFNGLGNKHLQLALEEDTEGKIKAWCFGHYHRPIDRIFSGVRFICNPQGRGNTPWSQNPYYPKRIQIEV